MILRYGGKLWHRHQRMSISLLARNGLENRFAYARDGG
jgi:hypothetical protein